MVAKTNLAELQRYVIQFVPSDKVLYVNQLFGIIGREIDELTAGPQGWDSQPTVKPLAPGQAREALKELNKQRVPGFVVEIVNQMLTEGSDRSSIVIRQDDVITQILNRGHVGVTRGAIFDNHWLDFEDIFREGGWKVTYDKPGYGDSYAAYWRFEK